MRIDSSRPRAPRGAASRSAFQRAISAAVLALLLLSPGGLGLLPASALGAPLADPFAPLAFTPHIVSAANGVPMVHIAAPNAAGLSLNRYQSLDVDAIGLIFNNSLASGTSQLGGAVGANPNLIGRSARVILNEVRGGAGSILAGPVEVFGPAASLIFANPNGISVNGARFINSPRVTLTTGTPLWLNGSGMSADFASATGFALEVSGGRIGVGNLGVTAPGRLDLIGETLLIDGPLTVTDALNLIAGRQRVEHDTLAVSSNGAVNSAQAIGTLRAIDASVFGALRAGQIQILSTAQGMGVRSAAGLAASSAGITLSANGDLEIKDASAPGAIALSAQGSLTTSGAVSGQSLSLSTPNSWTHSGSVDTRAAIGVSAGSIALNGALASGTDLTLQSTRLTSAAASSVRAAGELRIAAQSAELAGTLIANANLLLDLGTLTHSGLTQAAGEIRIQGATLANRGTLSADRSFVLSADSFSNAGGFLQGQDVRLNVAGALDNSGARLLALNDLDLHAATLNNDRAAPLITTSHSQLYDPALLNSVVLGTRRCGSGENFCNPVAVTIGQLAPNYVSFTLGGTGVRLPRVDQTISGEREAAQGHIVAARNADIELSGALSNRGSTIEAGERLAIAAASPIKARAQACAVA